MAKTTRLRCKVNTPGKLYRIKTIWRNSVADIQQMVAKRLKIDIHFLKLQRIQGNKLSFILIT